MSFLLFSFQHDKLTLENDLFMKDITHDQRSQMLDKKSMTSSNFKVQPHLFIMKNSLFFKMSKLLNKQTISAIYIRHEQNHIVVVHPKHTVFVNNKPVQIKNYSMNISSSLSGLKSLLSKKGMDDG